MRSAAASNASAPAKSIIGGATGGEPDAESRFRELLDEGEFLYCGKRWPRAPSAWRTHGVKTRFYHCLYCGEPFRFRGSKRELPHFCNAACLHAAQRVRAAYRDELIRELFAEGAGDRDLSVATGHSKNVVRQKCYEMGLGGPRRQKPGQA